MEVFSTVLVLENKINGIEVSRFSSFFFSYDNMYGITPLWNAYFLQKSLASLIFSRYAFEALGLLEEVAGEAVADVYVGFGSKMPNS